MDLDEQIRQELIEALDRKREELRSAIEDRLHEDEIAELRAEVTDLRERLARLN